MAGTDHDVANQVEAEPALRVANRLIVSIQRPGLRLPTFSNAEPLEVGCAELLLLAALAEPDGATRASAIEAAATGAEVGPEGRARLEQFIDRLAKDNWITTGSSDVPARAPVGTALDGSGRTPPPRARRHRRDLHADLRAARSRGL